MLALQQAYELKIALLDYLKATFTFQDKKVERAFLRLIADEREGMLRGPYLSLRLPFVKAGAGEPVPLEIQPAFTPYYHQAETFRRLSTQDGHTPQPTILTTGTSSGKTESFLYPLLDYCYRHRLRRGIKAIILYPMNALATDQAQRIADAIHADDRLRGQVTAGLFIGEGQHRRSFPQTMGERNIIEHRDTIVANPPDILLTNFKMLDYALMQAKYHHLWYHNLQDPGQLRFLVLDELHTYDGAQGTDVANLIRRVKLKLGIPPGHICPVGTSATIGSGAEAPRLLAEYAARVFGETFDETCIVGERRVSPEDFFAGAGEKAYIPTPFLLQDSLVRAADTVQDYLERQCRIWGIDPASDPVALGQELREYRIVRDLVTLCADGILEMDELLARLSHVNDEFRGLPATYSKPAFNPKEAVLRSLLSLIGAAKTDAAGRLPFLFQQVQLWARELSGILRLFQPEPAFTWKDSVTANAEIRALPPYFCRECGASGWLAVKHDNRNSIEADIADTYRKFFENHKNLYFANPWTLDNLKTDEYQPDDTIEQFADPLSLDLSHQQHGANFKIVAYRKVNGSYSEHYCPQCNSRNTIAIVGTKVNTLSSVAVAQILSTEMDKAPERDRKVLAFTNSVQDAAHQAGFIEARNFRFAFRTALQTVINQQTRPQTLSQVQQAFQEYWMANAAATKPLEAYLYKFLPSDHQGDAEIATTKAFVEEFNRRVDWEIASEYGYNALLGRTLEKTLSSGNFFDSAALTAAYQAIQPWLHDNALGSIDAAAFMRFLSVFLHRMRVRGGVGHPYLEKFRTEKSSYFLITQKVNPQYFLMRNFGKHTRLPKLITDQPNPFGVFDLTTKNTPSTNWFHAYFRKAFPLAPNNDALVNDFYTQLLDALATPGVALLDQKDAIGVRNFALRADALHASARALSFACDQCAHELFTTVEAGDIPEGAACSNFRCTGHYHLQAPEPAGNYYQQVYSRRRAPRIYAAEHTGLLERSDREEKEKSFKNRPDFNSLNVLVATSTLEMGINIGDLNATINNAIPPLPANFIQRVGRAGRSSGSALIVNFATNEAHDQYYFRDPLEMMQGAIATPGCYLEAREIMRRHFLAYCFDTWTKADPEHNLMPATFFGLRIDVLNPDDPAQFFNKMIAFVRDREPELLSAFRRHFEGQMEANTVEVVFRELENSLRSGQFYQQVRDIFREARDEFRALRQQRHEIKAYIDEEQLAEQDPLRQQLENDARNIRGLMRAIQKRSVPEYLTNKGLLPNYAFPETGVTLSATVRSKKSATASAGAAPAKSIEVVRPANTALRELVPDNYFYTQGFKLKVSGLQVTNWREEAIAYRFCSVCDSLEPDTGQKTPCPKCGDPSFGAASNRHKMLRIDAVRSFNDEASATLDDSSEERDAAISRVTRHFRFHPNGRQGAYAMVKIPFGIEYCREVELTEINEGLLKSEATPRKISIAGVEVAVHGYITCKHCGKSSSLLPPQNNPPQYYWHFPYCKHRETAYTGNAKDADIFEELWLYRKLRTEAIKILLPVQEFDSESLVAMFKAGIQLGLRRYYRGNPQHIEIRDYWETNQITRKTDRYLILFDVIPGGSGYLSKLFDTGEFNLVLYHAWEAIRDCDCQLTGKDGCYRCIYTYGNQFERESLSRTKAEELFRNLVRAAEHWDFFPQGLNDLTNSGSIEESELEERFIRVLQKHIEKNVASGWSFSRKLQNGIQYYECTLKNGAFAFTWRIQPQVNLGPADGVKYLTRCDFLLTCLDIQEKGVSIPAAILADIRPIALYLDGYQFHATAHNNRFNNDLQRREAISQSDRYWQWTLSWQDLTNFETEKSDFLQDLVRKCEKNFSKLIAVPTYRDFSPGFKNAANNLERLISWLTLPPEKSIGAQSSHLLMPLQTNFMGHNLDDTGIRSWCERREAQPTDFTPYRAIDAWACVDTLPLGDLATTKVGVQINSMKVRSAIHLVPVPAGADINKEAWEQFWTLYNLLQYHEPDILHIREQIPDALAKTEAPAQAVLDNFDPAWHSIVQNLIAKDIRFNRDTSFTLEDDDGIILAEAALGMADLKIVGGAFDEASKQQFESAGYRVYEVEHFPDL
jgi:DEAD/DEAH box helicase domain-containing protein